MEVKVLALSLIVGLLACGGGEEAEMEESAVEEMQEPTLPSMPIDTVMMDSMVDESGGWTDTVGDTIESM